MGKRAKCRHCKGKGKCKCFECKYSWSLRTLFRDHSASNGRKAAAEWSSRNSEKVGCAICAGEGRE